MAHTAMDPRGVVLRPDILAVIALAGVIGFALGQTLPPVASTEAQVADPVSEGWHGNVRRSHWSN
ncbi:hypothetical protein [Ruegeria sp. Alg231-54]|uniref:hypothetical protein n=1 Tax=Ruegeria sp. Alg231-54 TaxID=1922221 RepID=UPI000D5606D3|nr:hypothetical protein [Ruegeria sp. Alg231-54]